LASYIADPDAATGFTSAVITSASGTNGATILITSNFALGVAATITEAALQAGTSTTGGATEAAIQTFPAIPLGASDTLEVQWSVGIDG
jgi:hypothetical protein